MRWSSLVTVFSSSLLASQCLAFNVDRVAAKRDIIPALADHGLDVRKAIPPFPAGPAVVPPAAAGAAPVVDSAAGPVAPVVDNAAAALVAPVDSATGAVAAATSAVAAVTSQESSAPVNRVAHANNGKMVFAHFILGVAATHTQDTWVDDITAAKNAGVDGFALNIASQDSTTDLQLGNAFAIANKLGDFKLMLSFDYASTGAWSPGAVVSYINQYKSNGAYFQYNGKPVVSTFEGASNSGDWPSIKDQTGIFLLPSWSSTGCETAANYPYIDGMFSWDSWPVGATNMDTTEDTCWQNHLAGKPYMMGVSPHFYTSMSNYGKNWAWRGDSLWHDRWTQIASIQPSFVEIISWNDYGESHYVGPYRQQGIPAGAHRYADGVDHAALLQLLPYYIEAYKYGTQTVTSDKIVYWYRTSPCRNGDTGGTAGNAPWQPSAAVCDVVEDLISIAAVVTTGGSTVTVQVGSGQVKSFTASSAGVNYFSYAYGGDRGDVQITISRGGASVASAKGPAIVNSPSNGMTNFNPLAGSS